MFSILATALALGSAAPQAPPDPYQPEKCRFDLGQGTLRTATLGTQTVAAGEKIDLTIYYSRYPSDFNNIPVKCLTGWKVSSKTAMLARDRKSFTVDAAAKSGSEFTIAYSYRGKRFIQRYKVIEPTTSPITGFWTQEGVAACTDDDRVYDLVFNRDGSFGVMFGPNMGFRKDFTGKWRVEGNRVIVFDLNGAKPADFVGTATFSIDANGGLTFDRPWFGTSGKRGTCVAPFRKMR
ncbi:hypothetical protein [Sphingomonas sp.]|uniref:hypothetical protein n=1 Tax=Sphingomonas sp. TaxID=28214 RepID=UPI001EB3FDE7|nr:hypothetical protein [Sphingomonas sp.]MBX3594044.1 hypothetical protein [Sphingomonas sp.]